ncbi:uncharacterized protein LOC123926655 [Meles meles]|uniref:uncharacterized protein LOC123926655 n=1 Tax=Meles meles TaxID=9662 RepID=UPI001E69DD34|nr:uncharacterized protein LOC123926655 [Meles meles]
MQGYLEPVHLAPLPALGRVRSRSRTPSRTIIDTRPDQPSSGATTVGRGLDSHHPNDPGSRRQGRAGHDHGEKPSHPRRDGWEKLKSPNPENNEGWGRCCEIGSVSLGLSGCGKGSVTPPAATPANPDPTPGRSAEKPDEACHTHAPLRTGAEGGDRADACLRTEKPHHRGETDLWYGLQRGSSRKTPEAGPRPQALRRLAHEVSRTHRAPRREGFRAAGGDADWTPHGGLVIQQSWGTACPPAMGPHGPVDPCGGPHAVTVTTRGPRHSSHAPESVGDLAAAWPLSQEFGDRYSRMMVARGLRQVTQPPREGSGRGHKGPFLRASPVPLVAVDQPQQAASRRGCDGTDLEGIGPPP